MNMEEFLGILDEGESYVINQMDKKGYQFDGVKKRFKSEDDVYELVKYISKKDEPFSDKKSKPKADIWLITKAKRKGGEEGKSTIVAKGTEKEMRSELSSHRWEKGTGEGEPPIW